MSNKHTIARTHSKLSYETSKGKRDDEGMRGEKQNFLVYGICARRHLNAVNIPCTYKYRSICVMHTISSSIDPLWSSYVCVCVCRGVPGVRIYCLLFPTLPPPHTPTDWGKLLVRSSESATRGRRHFGKFSWTIGQRLNKWSDGFELNFIVCVYVCVCIGAQIQMCCTHKAKGGRQAGKGRWLATCVCKILCIIWLTIKLKCTQTNWQGRAWCVDK